MNYTAMDYMHNGIIVEDVDKSEILYINQVAKKILKIDEENQSRFQNIKQFISSEKLYDELKYHIKQDMELHNKSEGIVYLKATDNTFIEVNFCCIWEDEVNRTINYIFKKATEVLGESSISFKELAEYLPSGIVVMDVENKLAITYANAEHYRILGIDEDLSNKENPYLLREFIFEEDINWVLSEIHLNLSKNEDVDIEFRMKNKQGEPKWVRLFGRVKESTNGDRLFYSSLKDLSQRRSIHDKLHLERVLFHKITELTNETLFRLDLHTHILHLFGKTDDIFGEVKVCENYPNSAFNLYEVHEDDKEVHAELIECFKNGIEKNLEMRFKLKKNEWEWYSISYSFVKNIEGDPISVIGKFSNIQTRKLLEEQAKMDLLTGLYNKMTTENETDKLFMFSAEQSHAFFIIDIDDFKEINDNLGHHFGDMVLSSIAKDIYNCFRKNDIIGRIGGDEFVVIMRDVSNKAMIIEKAKAICNVLTKTFKGNDSSYKISASVGIAMYPEDGKTYEELYKRSDVALYETKRIGKNGYKQYYNDLKHKKTVNLPKKLNNSKIKPVLLNNVLTSHILNLLYETNDLSTSLKAIMEYVAFVMRVDRCYIFETFNEGNSYDERYRWDNPKAPPSIAENIDNSLIANAFKGADEDGVFFTNDIYSLEDERLIEVLEKDSVQSIFIVESMKVDNEHIVLGLEDCQSKRVWSEEEVVTLLHIGRLIFTAVSNSNMVTKLNKKIESSTHTYEHEHNSNVIDVYRDNVSVPKISSMIQKFYDEKDMEMAVSAIEREMCNIFGIDVISTIIYNKELGGYIKLAEMKKKGVFKNHLKDRGKRMNSIIDTLSYSLDETQENFMKLFKQNYLYSDDYKELKDELTKVGFKADDEENLSEVCVFTSEFSTFFGYTVCEKYNGEKLTSVELNALNTLFTMVIKRLVFMELIDSYEDDMLIVNTIKDNEQTPIIIVDKHTFEVIFVNAWSEKVFSNIKIGDTYNVLDEKDEALLIDEKYKNSHQWLKKTIPITLRSGRQAYMVYTKDNMDYVNKVNEKDELTQALQFRSFEAYYSSFIQKNQHKYALCTLDIDKFKYINKIYGYETGDNILIKTAMAISNLMNIEEDFCRLGGDKFSIFIRYDDEMHLDKKIRFLSEKLEEMQKMYFQEITITIFGGITFVDTKEELHTLLDQSTIARKTITNSIKNRFAYYNTKVDAQIKKEILLEDKVPYAIENNEFVPFLQAKFDLHTNKISGAEALVRWVTDDGMIFPDEFIPLFEKNGFINTLDFIIYEKVMAYIQECVKNKLEVYPISLNVSRNHIQDGDFMDKFMDLVNKYEVEPKYLELEITESVFVEDKEELNKFIKNIKIHGFKVSIDDFGTAYSSLQNLTDMDIDVLKIDKGFLDNIDILSEIPTKDEILLKNIINLAKDLDFNVICEGVETDAQVELLKKVACEYGQGYIFSRPIPISEYNEKFIAK